MKVYMKNTADLSFCNHVNNNVYEYMLIFNVLDEKIINEDIFEKINLCVYGSKGLVGGKNANCRSLSSLKASAATIYLRVFLKSFICF